MENAKNFMPEAFADLEQFAPDWILNTEQERFDKLHVSSMPDLEHFYTVMVARLPEVLQYLAKFSLSAMPEKVKPLFDLTMTFVETCHAVDLGWGDTDFAGAYPWQAIRFRSISCESRAQVVS